jgi:hypothetical protein
MISETRKTELNKNIPNDDSSRIGLADTSRARYVKRKQKGRSSILLAAIAIHFCPVCEIHIWSRKNSMYAIRFYTHYLCATEWHIDNFLCVYDMWG